LCYQCLGVHLLGQRHSEVAPSVAVKHDDVVPAFSIGHVADTQDLVLTMGNEGRLHIDHLWGLCGIKGRMLVLLSIGEFIRGASDRPGAYHAFRVVITAAIATSPAPERVGYRLSLYDYEKLCC
jgi:hypothetical protein